MEAAGFVLAGLLGIVSVLLFQALAKVAQENLQIKQKLIQYQSQDYLHRINGIIAGSKTSTKPKLQKQTEQLLVLAVRSNNENEARAAAVQACKRISKELEIK
jgi:hypothetical protein